MMIDAEIESPLPFDEESFRRYDQSDDAAFFASERFFHYFDWNVMSAMERVVTRRGLAVRPAVLDLLAGPHSHLPPGLDPSRVVGLGLDRSSLAANPALDEIVIHDLNRDPRLPLVDAAFDLILIALSVEYMTRPVEVFRELSRILRPGGLLLVAFTERTSPRKAVRIWLESGEQERISLVQGYLDRAARFERTRVSFTEAKTGLDGERVVVVSAATPCYGETRPIRSPETVAKAVPDHGPEEIEHRKQRVRKTLRCPYCDQSLSRSSVGDTLLNQWDVDEVLVCLSESCPYYARSADVLREQGVEGFSYRLMYDRKRDRFYTIPDIGFSGGG